MLLRHRAIILAYHYQSCYSLLPLHLPLVPTVPESDPGICVMSTPNSVCRCEVEERMRYFLAHRYTVVKLFVPLMVATRNPFVIPLRRCWFFATDTLVIAPANDWRPPHCGCSTGPQTTGRTIAAESSQATTV